MNVGHGIYRRTLQSRCLLYSRYVPLKLGVLLNQVEHLVTCKFEPVNQGFPNSRDKWATYWLISIFVGRNAETVFVIMVRALCKHVSRKSFDTYGLTFDFHVAWIIIKDKWCKAILRGKTFQILVNEIAPRKPRPKKSTRVTKVQIKNTNCNKIVRRGNTVCMLKFCKISLDY